MPDLWRWEVADHPVRHTRAAIQGSKASPITRQLAAPAGYYSCPLILLRRTCFWTRSSLGIGGNVSTVPKDIATYLREFAHLLEDRILQQFPPLHEPGAPFPPELRHLRRTPYPAQSLAIAGIAKRWDMENSAGAAVI